ncbi:MAG: iron ABC transporter permease [Anaerolineae bacterium]|jgi:iron complex transport system permease protein|nr:iron ABC transporter permease [Anaerolineae bacterium]MBT3712188.1 iron ABC transporter permease [Anaerolineae bacterium]MBT4312350.1 iron ABC transporter permease [Anaerolineae bacterium]MBT4457336.1 iron ABC transporter permease [Anaerolineae bacterium]MBT4842879.1 iron ABC transporter permease [Anaerolineae bacterium]
MIRQRPFLVNIIILLIAFTFSIALGAVFIHPSTILRILADQIPGINITPDWPNSFSAIILAVRLPRTVLVLLTGAALASSGAAYQGLFRNPLADPYLIGVASGAGLGAIFAMSLRWPMNLFGFYFIPVGAFIGAILTVVLVYSLARVNGLVPLTTLILAGVAVGAFASALTSFLMLRSDLQLHRAISFLLGGSPMTGWDPVIAALPYMVIGMGLLSVSGHALNILQFGEEEAKQMGLNVGRAKIFIIIVASLTTAVAVAFSGVIGFIGLIVPHTIRIIWGADYRRLISLSILGGGSALLFADMLARILIAPSSLPVGIVTALAGAPFFLWILRQAKREVFW